MPFVKINPAASRTVINQAYLGEVGSIFKVSLQGDYTLSSPHPGQESQYLYLNEDVFINGIGLEHGTASKPLGTAFGVSGGEQAYLVNGDRPLNDNRDPDGDFGANVEEVVFALTSSSGSGRTVVVIEGEPAPSMTFSLSQPVDFDITIKVAIAPSGYGSDISVWSDIILKSGQTSVVVPAMEALRDENLEPTEKGTISFTASASGRPIAISYEGSSLVQSFDLELEDRVIAGLEAVGEQEGYVWTNRVIKYAEDIWGVGSKTSPEAFGAQLAGKLAEIARIAGYAVDAGKVVSAYNSRTEAAEKLDGVDRLNSHYDARRAAFAEGLDTIFGNAAEGFSAAATAGMIAAISGASVTAAAPLLAGVAVGWAIKFTYEQYSPEIKAFLAAKFSETYSRSEFLEDHKDELPLPDLGMGSDGDDHINGTASAEYAAGGAGNDRFILHGGGDVLAGGRGLDVAAFETKRADFSIVAQQDGILKLLNLRSDYTGGADTIIDVERVQFSDGILAFDTDGTAGQAYRIYQAAFARTPDIDGLSFWINQLDQFADLHQVSQGFINSAEFQGLYGPQVDNRALVLRLYNNILQRDGEAAGVEFWTEAMDSGAMDRASVLAGFSESAENRALVAPALADGIWYT